MVFKMVMKWPAIAVKAMMVNEMVMETTMMTAIEIAMAMTRMAVEMVMAITILMAMEMVMVKDVKVMMKLVMMAIELTMGVVKVTAMEPKPTDELLRLLESSNNNLPSVQFEFWRT